MGLVGPRSALTFAGGHVDAFAVPAEWVRPPQSPGHIVEHRVVRPAEAAVILIGVEAQPPVVALHFVHLQRLQAKSHAQKLLQPVVCKDAWQRERRAKLTRFFFCLRMKGFH